MTKATGTSWTLKIQNTLHECFPLQSSISQWHEWAENNKENPLFSSHLHNC